MMHGQADGNALESFREDDMRFFIDKDARRAYLFADILTEEISLKLIFSHLTGAMPNTVKYIPAQVDKGLQAIAAHIEFMDSSVRRQQ